MKWLLLDAGNSALKWEALDASAVSWPGDAGAEVPAARSQGCIVFGSPAFASELSAACVGGEPGGNPGLTAVFGCSVTSAANVRAIETALLAAGAPAVHWLAAASRFEHDGILVHNRYAEPGQLGADRWNALIGARARFPRGPVVVISAGTATTVDALAPDGRFLGGVIAPGVEMMRRSLAGGTAQLPLAQGAYVAHPDNTQDAICTGVLEAQLGLVERRLRRMRETAGSSVQVVFSGGKARSMFDLLQAHLDPARSALEPDLVLRGLWHHARAVAAAELLHPRR